MLILLVSLPALGETPGLYEIAKEPVRTAFFDVDRARNFWEEDRTFLQLEKAYERCVDNQAFDYWNRVWLDTERGGGDGGYGNKTRDFIRRVWNPINGAGDRKLRSQYEAEYEANRAQFTLDYILGRYGTEGMELVNSDLDTIKYCHDLSRAYEKWRFEYASTAMGGQFSMMPRTDWIRVPYNEWDNAICESLQKKVGRDDVVLLSNTCELPDWRSPEEVANYDTALLNNVIRQQNEAKKNAKSRTQSRQVIEAYLSDHGDTLSDADRKALETMLKQLN
ncbi:hypothetical protein TH30_04680 [Thalassospira profundimaris]|uniref:Uncharacterized protein n=2 Tax=Thalassospiraceae TaxID=2844866 RepID=A0A367X271_9PROT|nr:hypothetical protein TH30_04680 [Thalassospira profundimaris]